MSLLTSCPMSETVEGNRIPSPGTTLQTTFSPAVSTPPFLNRFLKIRDLPVTGRRHLMALGSAANGSIITMGRQESSNETGVRTWRR